MCLMSGPQNSMTNVTELFPLYRSGNELYFNLTLLSDLHPNE